MTEILCAALPEFLAGLATTAVVAATTARYPGPAEAIGANAPARQATALHR
jgi:hypothetical protein